jgi:transposase-like protein
MASVGTQPPVVKLAQFVQDATRQAHGASRAQLQSILQAHVDETTAHELGRARGEPKTTALDRQQSSWHCSRCGSQRKGDFSYSGHYQRHVDTAHGAVTLGIPRVRCRCAGHVCPDFGRALPKRQRQWYDLRLAVVDLHVEGVSYRGVQRHLARQGSPVGLGGLSRHLAQFRGVDLSSTIAGGHAACVTADAAFARVAGARQAHYYAHEVLLRDAPLVRAGKPVAWYRTGKVLACHVAAEETQEGWSRVFEQLVTQDMVGFGQRVGLTSDGNQGLLTAADEWLPWSVKQRCTWHIAHRARDKAGADHRDALERSVLWVFKAPSEAEACTRLRAFVDRWGCTEPEATKSVVRKFAQGVTHLQHPQMALLPRTVGISERYNQEPKRRWRAMRGFGSVAGMEAMMRLIALRHNCIIDRTDWLMCAARSVWDAPVTAPTAQQQQRLTPTAYTTEGT